MTLFVIETFNLPCIDYRILLCYQSAVRHWQVPHFPPRRKLHPHLKIFRRNAMEMDDLKKMLAGFCIAGLIAGSALSLTGCPKKSA